MAEYAITFPRLLARRRAGAPPIADPYGYVVVDHPSGSTAWNFANRTFGPRGVGWSDIIRVIAEGEVDPDGGVPESRLAPFFPHGAVARFAVDPATRRLARVA